MKPQRESSASLAFVPVVATFGFYTLPAEWQTQAVIQCAPQLLAYLMLGVWAHYNTHPGSRLGLATHKIRPGLFWGILTGLIMGTVNTVIILYIVPTWGLDIGFLTQTPHAQVPFWIMVPWFIITIAMLVELNFRSFLLGRMITFFDAAPHTPDASLSLKRMTVLLPISISALTFSFDPFLVNTFRHLHWIAFWDGLVWGWMWLRMRNLYAVMTAHAVEVILIYLILHRILS